MFQFTTMKKCLLTFKRIWESKNVELLGITTEKDLEFDKHVNKICWKANRKHNVLSRMWEKRIISKSFIESHFFNWDSLHARLNSHYQARSHKKKKRKKMTVYRKSQLQLKGLTVKRCLLILDLKPLRS